MFTKDELHVIRAVLANAETKGIQAAAMVVALFHKTETLIQAEEQKLGKPADTNASAESGTDKPARADHSERDGDAN